MIYIGSDHAGFHLKCEIMDALDCEYIDLGTDSNTCCDYPIYAKNVCKAVLESVDNRGILICGTGTGMSICANKFLGIRAANCWSVEIASLAREHNDINVLCLGARFIPASVAIEIVRSFIYTPFSKESRHKRRLKMIEG